MKIIISFSAILLTWASICSADIVYMSEQNGEKRIVQMNNDGSNRRFVTDQGVWSLYPDISADGNLLTYVQGDNQDHLSVILEDKKKQERSVYKIEGKGMHLHPDLSGDGRFLAFSAPNEESQTQQIYLVDLQSKSAKPTKLTNKANSYFPTLSSDGKILIFQQNIDANHRQIVEFDLMNQIVRSISDSNVELNMSPAISFDDRYVAYTSFQNNNWDIHIYDRQSKTTKKVTSNSSKDFSPNFAPDGSLIFSSDRSGRFQLYTIKSSDLLAGNEVSVLTVEGEGDLYSPAYSGSMNYKQSVHQSIPNPGRSSFGVATLGNRVYIVGGHQGHEHTYPEESFLSNVDYFDGASNTWHSVAPRNFKSHGFEVIAHGNHLYAFGGFAYSAEHRPRWKSLDVVERYDPETDQWTVIGKMPHRRSSYVIGEAAGKAYIMGGWDSTPKFEGDLDGTFQRDIDVFDFATESFIPSTLKLPDPLRRAFTAVSKGSEIYLIGGIGQGASHFDLLDNVTIFNAQTQTWREGTKLPFATFAPAATFIHDELYVFGGMFKTSPQDYVYVNHIYRLMADQSAWTNTGRYLQEAKGFARVVNTDSNTALILGGHQYFIDGSDAPTRTVESFQFTK